MPVPIFLFESLDYWIADGYMDVLDIYAHLVYSSVYHCDLISLYL